MIFLPIVGRELRVAARRRGTYWGRVAAALAALVVGGWIMLIHHLRTPQSLGIAMFVALSVLAFFYSVLAGVPTTADCLSEEKREGTLGLLFLTDLKGHDIVLGKIVATSLSAFYGMLAIFPVMAIPLLAGGVTVGEFWRVVLVCLNNVFFSLTAGLFCSAVSRDERKSMALTLVGLLFLAIGLPLVGLLTMQFMHFRFAAPPVPHPVFFIPSPGYAAFMAFDETSRSFGNFNFFYQSVACIHAMAWALVIAACFVVPRTWQDKAPGAVPSRLRERWHEWAFGSSATRRAARERMLAINPFYWLAGRDRLKSTLVWTFLSVSGLGWAMGHRIFKRDWLYEGVYVLTALTLHTTLKFWLGSEACRRLGADRRSGALELLLSTPLTVKQIVGGQLLALWKQFAGPIAVVLLVDFIFLLQQRQDVSWVWLWVAGMIMLVADLMSLSWVGMWMGLRRRRSIRAIGGALVSILVLPWGLWALVATLIEFTHRFGGALSGTTWDEKAACLLWIFIGLVVDLALGWRACRRLLRDFRDVATQRFETRTGTGLRLKQ